MVDIDAYGKGGRAIRAGRREWNGTGPRHLALAIALALAAPVAMCAQHTAAQTPPATAIRTQPKRLPTIVVTATRIPERAFDVPASISAVKVGGPDDVQPGINASEYLQQIPGVMARDRQDYAEGEQVSIRGFGSSTTFGVGGVRVYVDGIPATMPDGQGDVSNFDFGGADRIEVLRGPFSALYGNSSGGVIQIFTADGSKPAEVLGNVGGGSNGSWRADVGARGTDGGFGYNVDLSQFETDGYREHSAATRTNGNAKFDFRIGKRGRLTLLLNTVSLPRSQDPAGLTLTQFRADPRQASAVNLRYNARKGVHQEQGGAVYTQGIGRHQQLRAMVYYGQRRVKQFLPIPKVAQFSPTSGGGVIGLGGEYRGADLRWTWKNDLAGRPFSVIVGTSYDWEGVHRRGFNNFAGDALGVQGALRRDEQDDVYNIDEYAQASWKFAPRWSLMVGARHSVVRFSSADRFVTATNGNDSGRLAFGATDPVAGLMFDVHPDWHLYASWGEGFDTPTQDQLAYRPDFATGLNFALHPQRTRSGEVGSKWLLSDGGRLDVALFQANTRDEIAVLSSSGGRTTYQNVGPVRRRGGELGFVLPFGDSWQWSAAYTFLDATFQSAFNEVRSGTRMPAVPRNLLHTKLRWGRDVGWHAGVSFDAASSTTANDAGTLAAPGYAIANLSGGYVFDNARYTIAPYARIDNIANHNYVGAIIVNQAQGAAFEAATGRTYWLGVRVRLRPGE
ncbi:MAG TPA: TonB-dependent receptor [Rhodanobacteraceae bacterium]